MALLEKAIESSSHIVIETQAFLANFVRHVWCVSANVVRRRILNCVEASMSYPKIPGIFILWTRTKYFSFFYQALHYSLPLQAFCLTALTRDPRLRKSAVNTFRRLPDIRSNWPILYLLPIPTQNIFTPCLRSICEGPLTLSCDRPSVITIAAFDLPLLERERRRE